MKAGRALGLAFALAAAATVVCGVVGYACGGRPFVEGVLLVLEEPEADLREAPSVEAWLRLHRDDVGLVVATVRPDGTLDETLSWNEDVARPLASAVKLVHLTAYALDVSDGRVTPDTVVPRADWEGSYVEGTDGGAHARSLARLGLGSDGDPTLDQLVSAMITESDNAAADALLARLGDASIERARGAFAIDGRIEVDPVHPLLGALLATEDPNVCEVSVPDLWTAMEASAASFRKVRVAFALPSLEAQRTRFDCVWPRATPRAFARVMGEVAAGEGLPVKAIEVMRRHLEWPMAFESNQRRFERFGAKGGSLAGMLTESFYVVPRDGPYAGQGRVVILFLQHVSFTAWLGLVSSFKHQDVMLTLATNPDSSTLSPALERAAP